MSGVSVGSDANLALALLGVLIAHALAVMSPGPSFVLVARRAAMSRRHGIVVALGMGAGALVWATAAVFGVHAILKHTPWLYRAMQVAGGLFLIYLAIQLWRHARAALPAVAAGAGTSQPGKSGLSAFALGLATQLSNPKVVVFFSSIFAALLPSQMPTWAIGLMLFLVFVVDAGWYMCVALAFSNPSARALYGRCKVVADRVTGGVLGLLGLKLLTGIR